MKVLLCVFVNVEKCCESKWILHLLCSFSHNFLLAFQNKFVCSSQLALFIFIKMISQMLLKLKYAIMFCSPWERIKTLFCFRHLSLFVTHMLGCDDDKDGVWSAAACPRRLSYVTWSLLPLLRSYHPAKRSLRKLKFTFFFDHMSHWKRLVYIKI